MSVYTFNSFWSVLFVPVSTFYYHSTNQHCLDNLFFLITSVQMSLALFLTLTVHSMWKLRGIHGGRSRDSLSQSMG